MLLLSLCLLCLLVLTCFCFPVSIVSCSSVNGEASPECLVNGTMANHVTTSLTQHHLGMSPPCEQGLPKASDLAFSSLPTMHIVESLDVQSPENCRLLPPEFDGRMFAKSCPEPAACVGSPGFITNKGSPLQLLNGYSQGKYFPPHWSMEDVNAALEVCIRSLDVRYVLFHSFCYSL